MTTMKTNLLKTGGIQRATRLGCAFLGLCLAVAAFAQADKSSASAGLTRGEALLVNVTATVEAVDPEKREVTLKGPLGNVVTVVADQRVKRFNEIKVGDEVTAEYYIAVLAELREPTAEEKESPLTVLGTMAKAPPGTSPAAGGLRMFKVVATVEGLDRPTRSLTLKGPRGKYVTVRDRDVENLQKLRLGDTIVVTYAEALAVSLEKKTAKASKD
jgi:hypothetical protein